MINLWIFVFTVRNILCLPAHEMVSVNDIVGKPKDIVSAPKTLLLYDQMKSPMNFTRLVETLKDSGHTVHKKAHDAKYVNLAPLGEYQYDNIIYLAARATGASKGEVTVEAILQFIDDYKGNVLVVGGEPIYDEGEVSHFVTGEFVRQLAIQAGIEYGPQKSYVVDYVNMSGKNAKIIKTNNTLKSNAVVSSQSNVLYSGMSLLLDPEHKTSFGILRGMTTTFVDGINNERTHSNLSGSTTTLVAGVQTLNGARITFSGSMYLFSDNFLSDRSTHSFVKDVLQWTFKQRGILAYSDLIHRKADENEPAYMYTMNDILTFQIKFWELYNGSWIPYVSDDVQLEYVMLDPYIRCFLKVKDNNTLEKTFKAPDKYGTFKFVIKYDRLGYNLLHLETIAALRNYKHDGYPRFLWVATPYYVSTFVTLFLFAIWASKYLYVVG